MSAQPQATNLLDMFAAPQQQQPVPTAPVALPFQTLNAEASHLEGLWMTNNI
jgi:hypothetical protein